MNAQIRCPIQSDGLEPTDSDLLDSPLDFIAQDHLHIRAVCVEMERLGDADVINRDGAMQILWFLTEELPVLIRDEDEDLFPLLLRRAEPDDDMPRLKARLDDEHANVMELLPAVTAVFKDLASSQRNLTAESRTQVVRFIRHMRRHLVFENAIVLPFARLRLTAGDLETLRLRMRARRGLS